MSPDLTNRLTYVGDGWTLVPLPHLGSIDGTTSRGIILMPDSSLWETSGMFEKIRGFNTRQPFAVVARGANWNLLSRDDGLLGTPLRPLAPARGNDDAATALARIELWAGFASSGRWTAATFQLNPRR